MQVFVKRLDGVTIILETSPSDLFQDIKKKVQNERVKIALENICLMHHNKRLSDEKYLSDYSIQEHDVIHLIYMKTGSLYQTLQ